MKNDEKLTKFIFLEKVSESLRKAPGGLRRPREGLSTIFAHGSRYTKKSKKFTKSASHNMSMALHRPPQVWTPPGLCPGPARKGGRATYVLLRGLQTSRCLLGAHWGRVCCWQLAGRLQHPFDCPRPVVKQDVRIFFKVSLHRRGPKARC